MENTTIWTEGTVAYQKPILSYLYADRGEKGFPGEAMVKNLLAMQETQEIQIQSLGWEDPLEEEMATHSSILAWEIQWTEEPGGL